MQTISATELARHTRHVLDKVGSSGEKVEIERNHTVIAIIMPPEKTMTASQALNGLEYSLTAEQADAWLKDSKGDFEESLRDPWA
jgi:antitoxin (DNA-binding transcriptional repressor) of toxin-antitoxin stability system